MRARLVLTAFLLVASAGVPGTTRTVPPAAAAGGAVWLSTLEATQGFDKLSAFRDGTFYAQYLGSYARSRDFGRTWEVMPAPPDQHIGSPGIRFASPKVGYSVTGSGPNPSDDPARYAEQLRRCGGISPLYRTADGGATWKFVCVPRTAIGSDPAFTTSSSPLATHPNGRSLLLVGEEYPRVRKDVACGEERSVVYTSHDAGAKWHRAVLPKGWTSGYRQQILDPSTVAHIAYRYDEVEAGGDCSASTTGLFVSRDGGRSFRLTYLCRTGSPCTSFAMVTRSRFLLGRADGSTLVSKDGGRTWRPGQRLFDQRWAASAGGTMRNGFWVQAFAFSDARNGFASTRGSGTWRTNGGGASWRQERSHECMWWIPGIGEIAAASPRHAVTGGPHFISTREETPGPETGCAAPDPQQPPSLAAAVASVRVGPTTHTVRADATLTRSR